MTSVPRTPLAGGCLLAAAILAGVALGAVYGQPSIGFLAGVGAGLALIVLIWLGDSYFSKRPRK